MDGFRYRVEKRRLNIMENILYVLEYIQTQTLTLKKRKWKTQKIYIKTYK